MSTPISNTTASSATSSSTESPPQPSAHHPQFAHHHQLPPQFTAPNAFPQEFNPFMQMQQQQQPPFGMMPPPHMMQQQYQLPPMPPMSQMPPMQMSPSNAMQMPPMMMSGGSGGAAAALLGGGGESGGNDYLRGFYEGTLRDHTSRFNSVMSVVGPLCVNLALFVGPLWYMRRRFLAMTAQMPKGGDKKGGMGGLMEMMMPLKPKQYKIEIKGTKFNDVIGIPEAKEDLKQYVDFLADPSKFTRLGARLPKGCLLTGQPGTGKTLLARAVAGEANRPFLTASGADFIEIFGGSGPKRVRELFEEARANAPCVVFIDEIDAIGQRGGGRSMGGGNSEENRTINQLLAELDGLSSSQAIVVIAATNYPDNIDKALTREGRFDRKVNIPMPDGKARRELFEFYLKKVVTGDAACKPKIYTFKKKEKEAEGDAKEKKPEPTPIITPEASIPPVVIPGVSNATYASALADRTPGVSPAQISTIVNEAALECAVVGDKAVTLPALQNAIDDVLIGKKHRQRMSDASLRRTAYHECGHALMAWRSPLQKDVIKVSIIPRGRAGGYTQQVQDEALEPKTDKFLFSQLCVLLGGRVAERIFMEDISTGAIDDLQRATKIAIDQLLSYGMSKHIGHLAFPSQDKSDGRAYMTYSEDLHALVEAEARELVGKAYEHTLKALTAEKAGLQKMAEQLLAEKEIHKKEIEAILGPRPVQADGAAAVTAGQGGVITAAM
jgi:AFG3 family protein